MALVPCHDIVSLTVILVIDDDNVEIFTKDRENISEEVPPPIVGGENSSSKRKRKQTSRVWEVFTELPK